MNVYGVKDLVVWYRGLHKRFRVVIVIRLKFGEYELVAMFLLP